MLLLMIMLLMMMMMTWPKPKLFQASALAKGGQHQLAAGRERWVRRMELRCPENRKPLCLLPSLKPFHLGDREGFEILQEAPRRELRKVKGSMNMQALQRMLHHRMMTRGRIGLGSSGLPITVEM